MNLFKRKKQKNKTKNSIENVVKNTLQPSRFDPNGSYTGLTEDMDRPIQDADDL